MRRVAGILALLLLVAACNLGPDYHRPVIDSPDEFQSQPTEETLANIEWWTLFKDPVLQQLIETSLAENKDLMAAAWRVDEARALLGFSKSEAWPSVGFNLQARRTRPSSEVVDIQIDEFDTFAGTAGISWEADLWGKFRRANEAARSELFAARWGRRALIVSLVSEAARAYFLLRDLDARLEISRNTLSSRRDSTNLIRERFNGGVVSELDVRQAEIQEATAAVAVPRFERQIVQVENALSVLLGRNPGPIPRGQELVDIELPEDPPSGLPSELLQRRPDVLQTEEVLHAQMARIGVAQALRFPSFGLTSTLGLQSQELSSFTDGGFWTVGAGFLGPIFEFGRNKRRVEVERARTEQLILNYEVVVLEAFREVEDSLIAIRTLRDEYRAWTMQTESALAASKLSRARYDGGVTSYLEVLDIERSLFEAELDASRTLQEHLSAIVDLYSALGGGWDPDEAWTLPESRIVRDDE